jgi:uncharacterized protein (DUF1778 family)
MSGVQRRKKNNRILVRVDDDERVLLERIAAAWGVTLSAAVRRLIRESKVAT